MVLSRIATGLLVLADKKPSTRTKQIYTEIRYKKFRSELHRLLYYWLEGYATKEHPWGIKGRPPFPETTPLPLTDKKAGKEVRELLLEKLEKGQWDAALRRLLREIEKDYKRL